MDRSRNCCDPPAISAVASSRPTSSNRSVIFSRRWRMDSFINLPGKNHAFCRASIETPRPNSAETLAHLGLRFPHIGKAAHSRGSLAPLTRHTICGRCRKVVLVHRNLVMGYAQLLVAGCLLLVGCAGGPVPKEKPDSHDPAALTIVAEIAL